MKPAYTGTAKSLHWLILALLIVQFVLAWTMPHIGRNTPLTALIDLHFSFGVLILFVVAIRLICRARARGWCAAMAAPDCPNGALAALPFAVRSADPRLD